MRWPVLFSLAILFFHGPARGDAHPSCQDLLATHVANNRGFVAWSKLNHVLSGHIESVLVLKVKNSRVAPDLGPLEAFDHLHLGAGVTSPDQKTLYFPLSGWSIRIHGARDALAAAFGPSLQFQTVFQKPGARPVPVHRPGPFGRGAKALRKRLGDWWWARCLAGAMLFIDNAYVALRDDMTWAPDKSEYHRFLAGVDPNPALVEMAHPPPRAKPAPTPRPAAAPRTYPPRAAARGADRLRPRGLEDLYGFIKGYAEPTEDLARPNVVRDIFKRLFAKSTGSLTPVTDQWLNDLFENFDYAASLTSRDRRRPVIDAWAELFFVTRRRPRAGVFNGASVGRDIASWPFADAAKPVPRPRYLKVADRLGKDDVLVLYDFLKERTLYAGDLAAPGVVRDLFSSLFTKLQGWRDPARTEWLGTLFGEFNYEDSFATADGRRAVLTAWRKLFAAVHRRTASGPFDRRRLEADIASWPYATRPQPPFRYDSARVRIDEFDEVELVQLAGDAPEALSRARDVIARTFSVAPAGTAGRTVRLDGRNHAAIDVIVAADPDATGDLTVVDVRRSKTSGEAYWSDVAARTGLTDEVIVIEGGTITMGQAEADEVLVPANVGARLRYAADLPHARLVEMITGLGSDPNTTVLELSPAGPYQLMLTGLNPNFVGDP